MPYAPPRHCGRGHPAFTGPRCPQCARDAKAAADKRRPNAASRGYTSTWQIARAEFLALPENKYCACGCGRVANMVDHKKAHKGSTALFWDRGNWQPMASVCNSRKAVREEGAFGRASGGRGLRL
jgi:5-methylcytosine-specific restriction protein A